jgi:predicted DsbA family dithiol-disulfide isomerase
MRVVIPIFFDYSSTLCYIAWRITAQLRRELPIDPLWKGVPITMRNKRVQPGMSIGESDLIKVRSVAAETGIAVEPPARWLDSNAALQGAELARRAGAFDPYHDAMFRAAFEDRLDIGKLEVMKEIAERAGMDPVAFGTEIESGSMAAQITKNKREADDFSAIGYPTFLLGDFPLIGIQPIDTMRLLFERFIALRTHEPGA